MNYSYTRIKVLYSLCFGHVVSRLFSYQELIFTTNMSPSVNVLSNHSDYEVPAISLQNVQLAFSMNGLIQDVLVADNIMHIVTKNIVYRFSLDNPSQASTIELTDVDRTGGIKMCWAHTLGLHLIVRTDYDHYFYLHGSYRSFKVLGRLKGHHIKNFIFREKADEKEIEVLAIEESNAFFSLVIKPHISLSQLNKRDDKTITQILTIDTKELIMCTIQDQALKIVTKREYLQWSLPPLMDLASCLKSEPTIKVQHRVIDEFLVHDDLHSYFVLDLVSNGIMSDDNLVNLTAEKMVTNKSLDIGLDSHFVTSEYFLILSNIEHSLIVFIDKLRSRLPILIELGQYSSFQKKCLGLAMDKVRDTLWTFSGNEVYEIKIENEPITLWKSLCDMGNYDEALQSIEKLKLDHQKGYKRRYVLAKKGFDILQKHNYGNIISKEALKRDLEVWLKGARFLAELNEPIEEVYLNLEKFHQNSVSKKLEYISSLVAVEFLKLYLERAKRASDETRCIILSTWVMHLYLRAHNSCLGSKAVEMNIVQEMQKFVKIYWEEFDRTLVLEMLSRADLEDLQISYALLHNDFQFVFEKFIANKNWDQAIKILERTFHDDPKLGDTLASSSSLLLLMNSPYKAIKAWSRLPNVDHVQFLPSILSYQHAKGFCEETTNVVMTFFENIIFQKSVRSSPILEAYIAALTETGDDLHDAATKSLIHLFDVLRKENSLDAFFDTELMLRFCIRFGKIEAAMHLLMHGLGKFDQALDLALQFNQRRLAEMVLEKYDSLQLMERLAFTRLSEDSDISSFSRSRVWSDISSMRRRLWLKYSAHLVKVMKDLPSYDKTASDCLDTYKKISIHVLELSQKFSKGQASLTLKDLLPLFPESVCIGDIKEEIINTLNEYQGEVNRLALEMKESSRVSRNLRSQALDFEKNGCKGHIGAVIRPGESCPLCELPIYQKNIMVFPNCQHAFHKECMIKYYLKLNHDYKFKRILKNFLKKQFSLESAQIDDFITKSCILCHDVNINKIGLPMDVENATESTWLI